MSVQKLILNAGPDAMYRQILGLDGRVTIITGAGSGIGRAAALTLANADARVYILDRDAKGAEETRRLISELQNKPLAEVLVCDITTEAACQAAVAEVVAKEKRVDILFNSAGLSGRDATMNDVARKLMMAVNVDGTKFMSQAVVPHMQQHRFGRIINMGSVVGHDHIPFDVGTVYKESKRQVHQLTREMALQVAGSGITVNAIAPGRVLTDLVMKPGFGWVAVSSNPVEAFREGCSTQSSGMMLDPLEIGVQVLMLCSWAQRAKNGSVEDLSDGWSVGHQKWTPDKMPPEFFAYRDAVQAATEVKITP